MKGPATSGATVRTRVLHLLSGREKGGIARVVREIAIGLPAEEVEVIVGTLGGAGFAGAPGVREVRFGRRGDLDLRAAARVLAFARREDVGIVHTHNVTAHLYGLLARLFNPRLIHVVHVHAHYRQILLGSQPSRLKRFLLLRGNARALRRCDHIIANSDSVRAFLEEEGAESDRIRVVYNGTDVSRLESEASLPCPATERLRERLHGEASRLAGGGRTKVVGAFGRLAPVKNYPLLLEAARRVLDAEPVTFVIAGDGPERARLERLVGRLGLAEHVYLAGWLPNPYPLLAAVDVVASSSIVEGFGLVLLEAMALGKPVVATEVGGVAEIVRHGETGLVSPPGDPVALADAILRLLRDPPLRRALGDRGRERAREEFSLTRMCDQVRGIYLSALKTRRPDGALVAHA